MFSRPDNNYNVSDDVIDAILKDQAHPIFHIVNYVKDGQKILDIGAGSGVLARAILKSKKNVSIDGVEPNRYAANMAANFYRTMLCGYVQEFYAEISEKKYDIIILADVIEHISDPLEMLKQLMKYIDSSTKIFISIPNVAFGGVRLALFNGSFNYTDSGLLERTHLRFFTRNTADKMFEKLELLTEHLFSLERSFYRVEFKRTELSASFISIFKLARLSDARAYQFLYILSKEANPEKFSQNIIIHAGTSFYSIMRDYFFYQSHFVKIYNLALKVIRKIQNA
ncbi:class I SAM-dependent methyltransferase [Methylophilus sp. 13]|uniref:class I SAM-dependent methyltransferase n=1 Tax=Methylophilus sp. 13 TaxID=2781018 RepID=UPI00188F2BBC|nr:class I SAM-dependent methyltransferase [Methylophilus sp. 13]MBF5038120.1 class I SAM-dependent methyltransferase [Methylophilus sp. 13]